MCCPCVAACRSACRVRCGCAGRHGWFIAPATPATPYAQSPSETTYNTGVGKPAEPLSIKWPRRTCSGTPRGGGRAEIVSQPTRSRTVRAAVSPSTIPAPFHRAHEDASAGRAFSLAHQEGAAQQSRQFDAREPVWLTRLLAWLAPRTQANIASLATRRAQRWRRLAAAAAHAAQIHSQLRFLDPSRALARHLAGRTPRPAH